MSTALLLALLLPCQSGCGAPAQSEPVGAAATGAGAPPRVTLDGALVPGEAFSLRVTSSVPASIGALLLGPIEVALPLPAFGATLYVGAPFVLESFGTDGDGCSPPLFAADPLPASLCGAAGAAQAVVLDASAPGGWRVSAGWRFTVGDPAGSAGVLQHPQLPLLTDARGFATGDLDGDGSLDVVVGSQFGQLVRVFLGLGGGAFGLGEELALTSTANSPELVDLDGDGALDVVYVGGGRVGILWGLGDGTFEPLQLVDDGGQSLGAVGTALAFPDLDGDGRLDVVLPHVIDDGVLALRQTAPRSFASPIASASGNSPVSVAGGDVDGDLTADLLVGHSLFGGGGGSSSDGLRLLRGNGDGTFQPPATLLADVGLYDFELLDVDGSGTLDVVGFELDSDRTLFLSGNGNGTFAAAVTSAPMTASGALALGDFDGDGSLDAAIGATGSFEHPRVEVVLDVTGAPSAPVSVVLPMATAWLEAVDFDEDGSLDLVGSNGEVGFVRGSGDGTFEALEVLLPSAETPALDAFADVDGDGRSDLVGRLNLSNGPGLPDSYIAVARGLPTGDFAAPVLTPSPVYTGGNISDLVLAEMDGDGTLDAVVSGSSGGTVVVPGNGDGTFGSAYPGLPQSAAVLRAADLDGDGAFDLIGNQLAADSVTVLRGNGDGTLTAWPSIANQIDYRGFDLGDLDADGDLDLVYTRSENSGKVTTYLGNGDGTFFQKANEAVPAQPGAPLIIDLDLDGKRDLVLSIGGSVERWPGLGSGFFGAGQPLGFDLSDGQIAVADMNTDGLPDLISTTGFTGTSRAVAVLPGIGGGQFGPVSQFGSGRGAGEFLLADIDGDGDRDLLFGIVGLTVIRNLAAGAP